MVYWPWPSWPRPTSPSPGRLGHRRAMPPGGALRPAVRAGRRGRSRGGRHLGHQPPSSTMTRTTRTRAISAWTSIRRRRRKRRRRISRPGKDAPPAAAAAGARAAAGGSRPGGRRRPTTTRTITTTTTRTTTRRRPAGARPGEAPGPAAGGDPRLVATNGA